MWILIAGLLWATCGWVWTTVYLGFIVAEAVGAKTGTRIPFID